MWNVKKELIPFLMAGDPNLEATRLIALALVQAGVRTLELGVPFSDPLADGAVLQRSAARALAQGTDLDGVLRLAARLTAECPDLRIVLFTYLNPLLSFGLDAYVKRAARAGVTATLAVDLPLEEAAPYREAHRRAGLKTVFLASPTTSKARLSLIAAASEPFLYYVSRAGVTGEQSKLSNTLLSELKNIQESVRCPLAVGFGISTPSQAAEVAKVAHAVIGSRIVRMVEEAPSALAAAEAVGAFARDCIGAIRAQERL
jgi:tryptophan synthase alpha chain